VKKPHPGVMFKHKLCQDIATAEPGTLNLEPLSLELIIKCINPKHYCQDIIGKYGQDKAKIILYLLCVYALNNTQTRNIRPPAPLLSEA
jgi:hypothetical protein